MRRGDQWWRSSPATDDVAIIHLRTIFPASGYAFLCNHRTTSLLHEEVRVLAGVLPARLWGALWQSGGAQFCSWLP